MRAFTSLAGHILGSHPQINGYYEMHLSYEDVAALDRQFETFLQGHALKENSRYIFDKLLHNDYVLKPESLDAAGLKILVSLRAPEQTIPSIVHLFAQKGTGDPYASPMEAAQYYVTRLQALADFCAGDAGDYSYFDAELLQRAPDKLLPQLSECLELDVPLRAEYQTFCETGKAGKGDSSPRIHLGHIDTEPVDYSGILIPAAALQEAQATYRACREEIIAHAARAVVL